jgi:hypothetical protein
MLPRGTTLSQGGCPLNNQLPTFQHPKTETETQFRKFC